MTRIHRRIRRIAACAVGAAAVLSFGTAATAAAAAPAQPATPTARVLGEGAADSIPNNYIVVLRDSVTAAGRVAADSGVLVKRYGGTVRNAYSSAVRGFSATLPAAAARRLAADPAVAYVEQDRVARVTSTQTDPPWGVDRIDERSLPLSNSFTYTGTTSNVTAYILDTGLRTSHSDFGGRARSGRDFVDNDAIANDCNGHGTHVAGTVGGRKYGVAKDVKLVGVRVLNCSGSGTYSQIIAGVDWVTKNAVKPAVANMSLGGSASAALDDAIRRSIASGVTYALAAGNDNVDACTKSPARTSQAITVGATDKYDKRASFSNYGKCLDIFAPGARILSTSYSGDTSTSTKSGTSMASPHVAGAAAIYLAAHPDATPAQVRDALVDGATADKLSNIGSASPNRLLYTGVASTTPASTGSVAAACTARQTTDVKTLSRTAVSSSLAISGCFGAAARTSSVAVNIKHPNRGSLVIDLVTPTGSALRLKSASLDTADDINSTYSVNASAYQRNGVWKLRVLDLSNGNSGYLDSWALTL